ncbi:hypothetical protein JCM6882_008270 [Rhodosporidiobolus microsporus]
MTSGRETAGKSSSQEQTQASGIVNAATTVSPDFLSSLAASYSMSAAALPSLVMPSTAIPTPSAATAYIAKSWNHIKGNSQHLTFTTDPLISGSKEIVMQLDYPKGSYSGLSGSDKGGVGNMQLGVWGKKKRRTMVSYEVGFNKGFDFVNGGKLPGSYGGDPGSGCSGGRNNPACFSLRMMWRKDGGGELYAYIPQYDGICESEGAYCHGDQVISFNRDRFSYTAGTYNTITEIAIMSSDTETANGVLAVYAGNKLAFERHDVVLSVNESVFFSTFMISSFFGGGSKEYASTANAYTYFRNFRFFEGDEASSESGEKVKASSGE